MENHHLATTIIIIDLGKKSQWVLKLMGESLRSIRILHTLFLRIRHSHYKGEILRWRHLAHTTLNKQSKLVSPVVGQTDIMCLLK